MIGLVFWSGVALVLYVYAGYPLLALALSRLHGRGRPPVRQDLPTVTLIVAAYNEEAVIGRKIAECLALDYPADRLDVIVAADGSNDATAHIARSFGDGRVTVMHRPERRGKMAAIERAAAAASGEILVFSDANNRYAPDAVRRLVARFTEGVGMVTGRKTVETADGLGYSEGLYWRYESAIRSAETRLGICVAWNGEILSVRRDLFEPAPRGFVNDDAWIAVQVLSGGHRIVYEPAAVSIETVSSTAAEERERRTRMFAGIWQMYAPSFVRSLPWRRPGALFALVSHKMLRPLVALGFVAIAGATVAALVDPPDAAGTSAFWALAAPWNLAAAAGQAMVYGAAVVGPRIGGRFARIAYVPRFLLDANIAALAGLRRQLQGGQSVTWTKATRSEPAGTPS